MAPLLPYRGKAEEILGRAAGSSPLPRGGERRARFGLSSGVVRLIFVISCLLPGPQFLIYLILWALLPNE